jgi:hypothetical protein
VVTGSLRVCFLIQIKPRVAQRATVNSSLQRSPKQRRSDGILGHPSGYLAAAALTR